MVKYSGNSVAMAILMAILFFARVWAGMTVVNWYLRLFGVAFAISYWQMLASTLVLTFIVSFFKTQKNQKT